jgi:hypothetical protein
MKNKDIKFFFVVCFLSVGAALGLVHSCASKVAPPIKEIQYVEVIDSAKIIELENVLQLTRDSLNVYKHDTIMSEDEFILRFKLERIRYYNECAGKGNNIKFLRGWLYRVLNE